MLLWEDDVIFREQFSTWWSEVESEVSDYNWDILFLYRRGPINSKIELGKPIQLTRINRTLHTHCFILREENFSMYQDARRIQIGFPSDSGKVFDYLSEKKCRVFSTNRNLAGQKGGVVSARTERSHGHHVKACFGVYDLNQENIRVYQTSSFYLVTDNGQSSGFNYRLTSDTGNERFPINDIAAKVWLCCLEPILVTDLLERIFESFPRAETTEPDILSVLAKFYELDTIGFVEVENK